MSGVRVPAAAVVAILSITGGVLVGSVTAQVPDQSARAHARTRIYATALAAIENDYVDMLDAGIIDPAKVTRSAVENACSIAAMILTTSALVTDIPEPEKAPPAGGGGMGMDM